MNLKKNGILILIQSVRSSICYVILAMFQHVDHQLKKKQKRRWFQIYAVKNMEMTLVIDI